MSYLQLQPGGKGNAPGQKYVNLAWNCWDPIRHRSVQHRFYVGRLVPPDQVIVNKKLTGAADVTVPLSDLRAHAGDRAACEVWLRNLAGPRGGTAGVARVDLVGEAWLIRHLAAAAGLTTALESGFGPTDGGALAGLAAHQFATGHALYRAECWLSQRELPAPWQGPLVASANVHDFVARIGADVARREAFLEHWVGQHQGDGTVLYDATSVSTYSPALDLAEWGYNRDDEALPQVNFSLAATTSGTPLFYRVLPGSIPDVRTLATTLQLARDYGLSRPALVLDRGYYSAANLRELLGLGCGLLLGVPWSVAQARAIFQRHRARLRSARRAFLYRGTPLHYAQDEWRLDDAVLTAHLFFDPARHADTCLRYEKTVLGLVAQAAGEHFRTGREARAWIAENAAGYARGLRVSAPPAAAVQVLLQPHALAVATARAGSTLILTHGRDPAATTAESVLRDYRARDLAEKLFDAFKTEHGQYRLRTAVDDSVQGRFFLGFLTLVLRAELEQRMRAAGLHQAWTDATVLDELGQIKALVNRQGARLLLEVTKKQRTLLAALRLPELT